MQLSLHISHLVPYSFNTGWSGIFFFNYMKFHVMTCQVILKRFIKTVHNIFRGWKPVMSAGQKQRESENNFLEGANRWEHEENLRTISMIFTRMHFSFSSWKRLSHRSNVSWQFVSKMQFEFEAFQIKVSRASVLACRGRFHFSNCRPDSLLPFLNH